MSYPVLLEACEMGDLEEIRRLLEEKGASVDQKFPLGRTPLICASMDGNVEAVRLLLEKGATVDVRGAFGNTALHWAASHDRSEVASALLRAGASMSIKNDSGETALDLALEDEEYAVETAEVLIKWRRQQSGKHARKSVRVQESDIPKEAKKAKSLLLVKELELELALALSKQSDQISDQLQREERSLEETKARVCELRESLKAVNDMSGRKTKAEMDSLSRDIARLKVAAAEEEEEEEEEEGGKEEEEKGGQPVRKRARRRRKDLSCPVCMERPETIFCCQTCDNAVCGDCKIRLSSCPMCRSSFAVLEGGRAPLRNRLAERLLKEGEGEA